MYRDVKHLNVWLEDYRICCNLWQTYHVSGCKCCHSNQNILKWPLISFYRSLDPWRFASKRILRSRCMKRLHEIIPYDAVSAQRIMGVGKQGA